MNNSQLIEIAKCGGCGANLIFSPARGQLFCQHCQSSLQVRGAGQAVNLPLNTLNQTAAWTQETHTYECKSCGASEILNKTEMATTCAFCGTNNIVEKETIKGLRPNAVVPFKIDLDKAALIAKKWFKKRFFAPNAFKQCATPKEVKGVYYPAFCFNAATMSQFRGVLVQVTTRTIMVNGKPSVVIDENRFPIQGNMPRLFTDVLIQACDSFRPKTVRKMLPFSINNMPSYNPDYLFGFVASQHTKSGGKAWGEARRVMDEQIKKQILSGYTYSRVESFHVQTQTRGETYKYTLLPVYVGHCKYKDKLYNFYLNGENGKIDASAPVSALKVLLTVLFPIGLLALLGSGVVKLFKKIFKKRK